MGYLRSSYIIVHCLNIFKLYMCVVKGGRKWKNNFENINITWFLTLKLHVFSGHFKAIRIDYIFPTEIGICYYETSSGSSAGIKELLKDLLYYVFQILNMNFDIAFVLHCQVYTFLEDIWKIDRNIILAVVVRIKGGTKILLWKAQGKEYTECSP